MNASSGEDFAALIIDAGMEERLAASPICKGGRLRAMPEQIRRRVCPHSLSHSKIDSSIPATLGDNRNFPVDFFLRSSVVVTLVHRPGATGRSFFS
jgi:hypothetical protein